MAKKASPQDDTGSAPSVPFEAATTDAVMTVPLALPVPELEPEPPKGGTPSAEPARAPLKPARVLIRGRLNRVSLAEARAMRR